MGCDSQTHNHMNTSTMPCFILFSSLLLRSGLKVARISIAIYSQPSLRLSGLNTPLLSRREHAHVHEVSLALHLMTVETDRSHAGNTKFEDWHPHRCDSWRTEQYATDRSLMSSNVPGRQRKIRRYHRISRVLGQIGDTKRRPGLRGIR